jgi:hypothetical protein
MQIGTEYLICEPWLAIAGKPPIVQIGGSARGYQELFALCGTKVTQPGGGSGPTVCLCIGTLRAIILICRDEVRQDRQLTADETRHASKRARRPRAPGRARLRGCSLCRRGCPLALTPLAERNRLADRSPHADPPLCADAVSVAIGGEAVQI